MRRMVGRCLAGLFAVVLLATGASAQSVVTKFADVHTVLETGDYVVVIDRADRETWGRVVALSGSELTVAVVQRTDERLLITSDTRVFTQDNVALILRSSADGRKGPAIYPATWDTVETLPSATDVVVHLAGGERRRYRFDSAAGDTLQLLTPSGGRETVDKSRVVRVERHGVADSSVDGTLIGALIGAGTGIALVSIGYATCGSCDAPGYGEMYSAGIVFGAGIGAAAGWVIDKLHKGKETVFPVVSPVLTARHKGLALSLRF